MAVKFFGQFLVEKGVVSREKLLEAIDLQEKNNLKFGETALNMGMICKADVERVHDAQRCEDLRFGDMAVKLGLISPNQMQQVLTRQKNNHLYIGEALVKVGALDEGEILRYLAEFKEDQAPYTAERVNLPPGVSNPQVWEMGADMTYKMLTRIAQFAFRPAPSEEAETVNARHLAVAIDFSGSVKCRYVLSVSEGAQQAIAKAILKEDDVSDEPREVLDDTVMEFINIVCGNIAAKGAQLGHTLEINPPVVIAEGGREVEVPPSFRAIRFPVYISDGEEVEFSFWVG
ncbi:MAG: chemotaxis protein CheX [Geoalkalibacter sp.]|jgi:CheY-specific phosphatase CheX|uniref:chemotaxis protein CheX n=1 Tax=Geoalkalibacter sp. TaxID=3041440 RepID=UPI002AA0A7BC|nr:chemotaxis protein CheX [Thermodesulfobacteriota bacterium]